MKYSARVQFFFQKLVRRVKVAESKALYRLCGLIRVTARRTLRVRPGPSTPGTPPHAHTRNGLRDIEFSVLGNTGIIGPIKYSGANQWNEPVPHVHEFGGTYFSRYITATYPKRPYMSEALRKLREKGLIPRQFSVVMAEVL